MTKDVEEPHNNENIRFISHNFEAMNKAIDTEVEKRHEISSLYHYQQTSRRTLMLLHVVLSVSVVALTAAIIYWLFSHNSSAVQLNTPTASQTPVDLQESGLRERDTYSALDTLSEQENAALKERNYINTSFTVFHRTLLPTGEFAVTGKNFQPSNLRTPNEQYCYLEKNQEAGSLSAIPLAVIDAGEFILETDKPELINYAKQYCQFSQ